MYGIQPIWPSEYVRVTSGYRTSIPEKSQSARDPSASSWVSVDDTAGGASADVDGILDPEPLCMQITVPVSSHAATNGSQYRLASCTDGSPRLPGSSEKHTALTPRAALRRTSSAASTGSHS